MIKKFKHIKSELGDGINLDVIGEKEEYYAEDGFLFFSTNKGIQVS